MMKRNRDGVPVCYEADYPRLSINPETEAHLCAGCGAPAKLTDEEPSNLGSYFYVCSESGASLGWSGV